MELVTEKRPVDPEFGENKDIVQWVCGEMQSHFRSLERRCCKGSENRYSLHDEDSDGDAVYEDGVPNAGRGRAL